jgi:hypothetical protein
MLSQTKEPLPVVSVSEDRPCDIIKNLRIDFRTITIPEIDQTYCIVKNQLNNNGNSIELPIDTVEAKIETVIPQGRYNNTWAMGVNRTRLNPPINLNGKYQLPEKVDGAMIKYSLNAKRANNNVKFSLDFNSLRKDAPKIGVWFGK